MLLALDISAAFDAVDHMTMVERARTVFGSNGATLDWLRSFVTERSQFIAVGTERSETVACLSGVPQLWLCPWPDIVLHVCIACW